MAGKEFDERLVLPPRLATNGDSFPSVESDGDADHGTSYQKRKRRMVDVLLDPAGIGFGSC